MVEQRTGSAVPVSTHQSESTVIPIGIDKAWALFKSFKLETVVPSKVKETKYTSGGPNQLDSVIEIHYTDGAKWELRINEISDVKH